MTIFDLLFIAVFFATILTLLFAAFAAVRGRGAQAFHIVKTLVIGLALYMSIVVLSSSLLPRRMVNVGEPVCYDDWCISADSVNKQSGQGSISYTVMLRLSSRARRRSQRENGMVVYLTDERNERYDPIPEKAAVPFSVMLQPQESVIASRSFEVPAYAKIAGLVITHERSGIPISWFIIGYEGWFRKPTIVRLPS